MKKSYFKLAAPLVACLLTFLFFVPHLLMGRIPFPADAFLALYHPARDISLDGFSPGTIPAKNPLITDPILQAYPWRKLVINNLKEGLLPLWNPYSFSGQPLLANIQSSPFSIFNLLFLIFNFNIAWAVTLILPSILTTFFMFLFLRNLKLSRTASIFGAFVLPFTGFFIAWLSWGSIVATVMWLPLILLAIARLTSKVSPLWFLVLVFAISQVFLSGHWQAGSYVLVAGLLFLLTQKSNMKSPYNLLVILASFILAILVSMVQILPALEFLQFSARAIDQGYYPGRQDWFIPLAHLIQLIAPDFFGNPTTYNYWGVFNYGEFVSFIGIIPLSLALFALIAKSPNIKFFIALAIISLVFALENPISKIPFILNLPFISTAQPSRIIMLLNFTLAALAAFGLDAVLKEKSKIKSLIVPFLILALLVILALFVLTKTFFPPSPQIDTAQVALRNLVIPALTALAIIVVVLLKRAKPAPVIILAIFVLTLLELFRFGTKFISFSKLSWIFPQTQTTTFLAVQEKPFRIMSTDRRIMHPNVSAVYGIESIDGYDPLYLANWNKFVSVWQSQNPDASLSPFNRIVTPQKIDSKLVDLLNIKYVLTFDEIENSNFEKVFTEGQTKIYQNKNVLPRAYFASEVVGAKSDQEEFTKLLDPDFDLKKMATSQEFKFPKQELTAKVSFESYQDQNLTLSAQTDRQAPLILTNVYYPGWKAYIDGQPVPVNKADFMFQSIIIPGGSHKIEFKYQPDSFYNGVYLSLAAVVGTMLFSLYLWKRKYQ